LTRLGHHLGLSIRTSAFGNVNYIKLDDKRCTLARYESINNI